MKPIDRPLYLKRIEPMINTEFIKIITGVRRSGKSYLLLMIKDKLLSMGVDEDQIIYINFENKVSRFFLMMNFKVSVKLSLKLNFQQSNHWTYL
ncbi:AAA family ATPase [Lactobacillus amylovorus]|uniref:AAA family ATPase n=1 Tax=Lactobacillus amylovorus TaxID=1604 RepID=UPI003F94A66F